MAFKSNEGLIFSSIVAIIFAIIAPVLKRFESSYPLFIGIGIGTILYLYGTWVATNEAKQYNEKHVWFTPVIQIVAWISYMIILIK